MTLLAIVCTVLAGCSAGSNAQVVTESAMLEDLKRALTDYAEKKGGAAPKSIKDLEPFGPSFEAAMHALKQKKCTYIYGTKLSSSSEIIAYETSAEANGGAVLLANGEIKTLTAAEFAAAPKAKP